MKQIYEKILLLAMCASFVGVVAADNSFRRKMEIFNKGMGEEKIVKQFAERAAAGDVNGAMKLLTPAIRGREAIVERDFKKRIFPFFKHYKKMHNAKTIGSSVFPDRSRGTTHYVYVITEKGDKKPFMISFRREQGRSVILSIEVNKCVPRRHLSCD
jgi:hypothetical protein